MAIDVALTIGLSAAAFSFFYLGYAGRDNRIFRTFFILLGFLVFYVLFSFLATFTAAYTVPGTANVPYYNQADIATLTNLNYTLQSALMYAALLYLAIEIILYLKYWLDVRKMKKQQAKNSYPDYKAD